MKNKKYLINIIISIVLLFIAVFATIKMMPFLISLKDEQARLQFKEYVDSLGFWGYLLMLGLQILQVIIAFIPGEAVEILAGMMYGVWGGLLLCFIGVFIATWFSFVLTRFLGKPLITTKKEKQELSKYKFLESEKKTEKIFFILFFIPATPKDLFNYIAPFTKIKLSKYLLISTFARFPSIISSTYIGYNLMDGNYILSISLFVFVGLLGVLGLYLNNRFVKRKANLEVVQDNKKDE